MKYFITGTDTDCGKTYVTRQLLSYFQKNNKKVAAIKPVASGCYLRDGKLISEDAELINALETSPSWRFHEPIAPHIAAHNANTRLCAKAIAASCVNPSFDALDILLIEGAGGLLVPLNEEETWVDFLVHSQIPVILVVGMRLGCINHALLTAAVLKHHQITCAGWIANCIDPKMLFLKENIQSLEKRLSTPLLATIPFEVLINKP